MSRKNLLLLTLILTASILSFGLADQLDNVETAYVFINSIVFDQTGNQLLDFTDRYELEDMYPNKVVSAVNVQAPSNALGSNFSSYANIDYGGELKIQLPTFPQDAQSIRVYYKYREWQKSGKFLGGFLGKGKYVYHTKVTTITPSKDGSTSYTLKLHKDQTIYIETIGKEIWFKNHGAPEKYGWWFFGTERTFPLWLAVVEVHNAKIPLVFPKIAIDGHRNIYTTFKSYSPFRSVGGGKYEREMSLTVEKNGQTDMFSIPVGTEQFVKTGVASYDRVGDPLKPKVSLAINPQGSRIYITADKPSSRLYTYDVEQSKLTEKALGFVPEQMTVSTKNREEEWVHYSLAQGLSIAETWGPENAIEDCERYELYKNKVYKTTNMYDIFNGNAAGGDYINIAYKDVWGNNLTFYQPGEGFEYSNTGANTSAQYALGNTPYSWTAMGRRASMGITMGVEVKKGEELFIWERSNFKTEEYEFSVKNGENDFRIETDEAEDYRISYNDKVVTITDVGPTPMKQVQKKKKKWIIWPFWYKWEYYYVWEPDPYLNNPGNFGLTAFYNIACIKLTHVPYESIQYFAADGYGNKYTVRRTFGDYLKWKTSGAVVRNGQAVHFYKRETKFTLYKLDVNNNETELFTSPNIGWSYYYRTESPWPPGSCGCKGVKLSDYIPIYEAVAEADLATMNYSMPPKETGAPIVDIKVTPTDAPLLQMLGVTGELFMNIDENTLVSSVVSPSNDVVFENYDGVEWGQKFLGEFAVPEGKRAAPSGIINTHNPYLFTPNEYYYRYNLINVINDDIDGDLNVPDGATDLSHQYNANVNVTGGGFPSNVVLGRHYNYASAEEADPRRDSRYYVWAIRRLAIYNPFKEGTPNTPSPAPGEDGGESLGDIGNIDDLIANGTLVNAETPWTIINHGARDYTDIEYARKIMQDANVDFISNQEFINQGATLEGFRFQPGTYKFDDGGIYEIMCVAGYRYIDWAAMRAESEAGNLMFWWDEPDYIKDAEPMKPDIEKVIVRAIPPEDRPNLLCAVIDGDTNESPEYNPNKMLSNWQSFDDDSDGIPDHAVVEMNEDFDHKWTLKLVQKDRNGNILSDNAELTFVPNREQQQEIQSEIEPDEINKDTATENGLATADKYSGIAYESSGGMKMHYQWKVETMMDDQVYGFNYYPNVEENTLDIDVPYIQNNYQPWQSRVQETGTEGLILGQDGERRTSAFSTIFNTPILPLHYRVTFTMWYTRIDYFDEDGNLAYPLVDESGQVIGFDCEETIEEIKFYVDVYVKDTTLPRVVLQEPLKDGGTTGDPFPRDIIAYVSDNNPFDSVTQAEYNNIVANFGDKNYVSPGTRAYLLYPRRLDPNKNPADVFEFEDSFADPVDSPENNDGWKWDRPSLDDDKEFAFMSVTNAISGYDIPGLLECTYEVTLFADEEDLKLLMPFDAVTNDLYGHFKYLVVAEDGMRNYFETYRNNIPVEIAGSASSTTFSYPGDGNAYRQMTNRVHVNEDADYENRHTIGVPKNIDDPGMLEENASFIQSMQLNTIDPTPFNAGSFFPDDEGEFLVYKQAGGPAEDGYYGMQEGEIFIKDNDPPEVYLRVTNPKRNITIGYYIYDWNNVDGIDGDDDRLSYPFRDETTYDEAIPGLLALEDEADRGELAVAVGGGDHDFFLDPEIIEIPDGYPTVIDQMQAQTAPWYGQGFIAGGGLAGGITGSEDFHDMVYDFEAVNDLDTLYLEEDGRIKFELAAVDNVNNPIKSGGESSIMLTLGGVYEGDMLEFVDNTVNSATYMTNLEDGTGSTPNLRWDDSASVAGDGRVINYHVFRESTRDEEGDEYLYVRVRDNASDNVDECNEILFVIPVRILNIKLLDTRIHNLRKEDKLK